ncbi:hypothetical protein SMSP2_01534 [Limihaloglobus sulfuriphilus]|uniref:Uncharacterized protein n=1 Tax=Limihaloglobus sulfuriphilus TaxID=1851148 RepID=A0A1Q2MF46_9BACT|nr:hypothetical protein [Limihaloglobus sulfuriphilus]AQQ71168.1 hypothetical protein SMSP2_01534 [Limihaloglobus sulfuriphilus]
MASELTKSEKLFEELCCSNDIKFKRLPEGENQQPDYLLDLNGTKVIFEIKQIEPNDYDKKFNRELSEKGTATETRNTDKVAKRVRNAIDSASKQIKSYINENGQVPAVVVIFDNAKNGYTDSYTIQTALYGWERFLISTGRDYKVVDRGFGDRNNKMLGNERKTHISAVASMHEYWEIEEPHERRLSLCFYHNQYAQNFFDWHLWDSEFISHLTLEDKSPGNFQNWVSLRGLENA